jgi:hypothetical protein
MMWQTELGYIVRDAIEHGVSPVEFVKEVQESWRDALHDKQRSAAVDFNNLLEKGEPWHK